jgi:hypothetical protein
MGSLDTHPHMAAAELFRSAWCYSPRLGCMAARASTRTQPSHFHISSVISRESFRFFFFFFFFFFFQQQQPSRIERGA